VSGAGAAAAAVFAFGAGAGAGAAFVGAAGVLLADFAGAALVVATGAALAGAGFAVVLLVAFGASFFAAAAFFTGAAFATGFFATAFVAGAAAAFFAGAAAFLATGFAALFVAGFAAARTAVFAGAFVAFAPATTFPVFFTSPAPPFLAAPLAAAELRAFFAISFTSVAVAAGCYSPDALPQQPIFWDTVHWPTPVDTGPTVTRLLLFLLSFYKRWLSPMLGARCRFHPSCSDYARVAIARFGPLRGGTLGAWRLLRCQPMCAGGHDPVPDHFVLRRCGAQGAHTHD